MAIEGTGARFAQELGQGWKISPSIHIQPNETVTLAEIEGPGAIQHIWLTMRPSTGAISSCASIGMVKPAPRWKCRWVTSSATAGESAATSIRCLSRSTRPAASTATGRCPFRKSARITLENLLPKEARSFYYQIDYTLTDVPGGPGLFPRPVAARESAALR
jgi:hypothetical protein